jgi:hypothetical protein
MPHAYEQDVAAWAHEQAAYLRTGQYDLLDIDHLTEEIESMGNSFERELESRLTVLVLHLIKWQYQPARQGRSWALTIKHQRKKVQQRLTKTPSLAPRLRDDEFMEGIWQDAIYLAAKETGLETLPEASPWGVDQILDAEFWPGE